MPSPALSTVTSAHAMASPSDSTYVPACTRTTCPGFAARTASASVIDTTLLLLLLLLVVFPENWNCPT